MNFKPLAFKYLHQMHSPGVPFVAFNIPTALVVDKPGFYSPTQGRLWKVSRALATEFFYKHPIVIDSYVIIEVWNDRSTTQAPQFALMGYALILEPDLEKVLDRGVLAVNITTLG